VEAVFTVAIVGFIRKVSPGTIYEGAEKRIRPVYAFLVGLVCLSPLGLLGSGAAWGEGGMANGFVFKALMPAYSIGGLPGTAGYILSAVTGAAILVIVFKLISLIKKKKVSATGST
jgi:cobalt/nickel transport system permease protein